MSNAVSYTRTNVIGLKLSPILALLAFLLIPNDMIGYEGRFVISPIALVGTYWVPFPWQRPH
ncbi:hypothetical protein [Shouchella patagoniensis]|uniref:hypothetical protein n=1 Tax=Shouchella patagoniensis TaxID=228576 RepID=UPI00111663CC|nr:hypothetical protein [Shouchella patagoniensis]